MIPHSRPMLGFEEERAVLKTIRTGMIGGGETISAFVKDMSDFVGMDGGIATNSGTTALFLAMRAIAVGPGMEVLLPSYVCASVYMAVLNAGATPILVDSGAGCYNIDALDALTKKSTKTAAVIVPHLFGEVVDIESFRGLGIPIIEDLAQAVGGHDRRGLPAGGAGDYSIFSFYATKVMSTGQGGMVLTREAESLRILRQLATYDELPELHEGYNAGMSELQAAIGREQLKKLPAFVGKRREIASEYDSVISQAGFARISTTGFPYRYVINVKNPDCFISDMEALGVKCAKPVYTPLHRYLGFRDELFPNASFAMEHAVSIPLYPALSEREVVQVKSAIRKVLMKKE